MITGKYGDMSALGFVRFLLSEMVKIGYFHSPLTLLEQAVARAMWAVGNTLDRSSVEFEPLKVRKKDSPDYLPLPPTEYVESIVEWMQTDVVEDTPVLDFLVQALFDALRGVARDFERLEKESKKEPAEEKPEKKRLLPTEADVQWAAEEFGVTPATINAWCREGALRPSRVAGTARRPIRYFDPHEIIAAAKIYRTRPRFGASSLYGDEWRGPQKKRR